MQNNPDATRLVQRIGGEEDSPEKKNRVRKAFFYAWTAVGFILLFAVLLSLLNILSLPISMLIWTLVIVFSLRGLVNGIEKRGVGRLWGTVLAYVVMFLVLGAIGFMMFSPVFGLNNQFADLISSIPGYIDAISKWFAGISEKYADVLNNNAVRSAMESAGKSFTDWA